MKVLNLRKVPDKLYKKLRLKWVNEEPKLGFHSFVLSLLEKSVKEVKK